MRSVLIAGFSVVMLFGLSAVQAAEQKQPANQKQAAAQKQTADQKQTTDQNQGQTQELWRYTFHNGEWWYWLPKARWVYWRDNRWNDYDPKTYILPNSSAVAVIGPNGSAYRSPAAANSDTRPFYGHALSDLDRRTLEPNNEVGPFYGHALPNEVFSGWRARRSIRPFYGHAVSSDGD